MKSDFNVEFEKFHGASNDFIFIADSFLNRFSNQTEIKNFAKSVCDRFRGVGADGIIFYQFLKNVNVTSVRILIINSDGSFAATCGNALRCLGLKLLQDQIWDGLNHLPIFRLIPEFISNHTENILLDEQFILQKNSFAILTKANSLNSAFANVSVAMGKEIEIKQTVLVPNSFNQFKNFNNVSPIFVSLSNPHWVFISSEFKLFTRKMFEEFGQFAQNELRNKVTEGSVPLANIGMLSYEEKNAEQWNLVVYERGAGLTECCGSGGVAARIALEFTQDVTKQKNEIYFKMPGGLISISNLVDIKEHGEQRVLSGPAKKVFNGNIPHYPLY